MEDNVARIINMHEKCANILTYAKTLDEKEVVDPYTEKGRSSNPLQADVPK